MFRIGKGRGVRILRAGGGICRRVLLAALLALAVLLPPGTARAEAPPQSAVLSARDQQDLQRIAAYLNSIGTMTARFEQYSANGETAGGWLWMERPGRMRFQYDPRRRFC